MRAFFSPPKEESPGKKKKGETSISFFSTLMVEENVWREGGKEKDKFCFSFFVGDDENDMIGNRND